MKKSLECWVNLAASQLTGMIDAKDDVEAKYHAGVYIRIANKLSISKDVYKRELGYELIDGYNIAMKNYTHMREILYNNKKKK